MAPHPKPGFAVVVISEGQVIVGGGTDATVTAQLQVEVLPQLSVAVAVTVVFPIGYRAPGGTSIVRSEIPIGEDALTT